MRELRTSGSVGARGGKPPWATRLFGTPEPAPSGGGIKETRVCLTPAAAPAGDRFPLRSRVKYLGKGITGKVAAARHGFLDSGRGMKGPTHEDRLCPGLDRRPEPGLAAG